jgi:hypothetical protein
MNFDQTWCIFSPKENLDPYWCSRSKVKVTGSNFYGHNFERDPPKDHPCQVWFNLVQGFQRRTFKCESLRRTTDAKWWQKLTRPLTPMHLVQKVEVTRGQHLPIYRCRTASQVSLFVGFLISWISLPTKTTKIGSPWIKVISMFVNDLILNACIINSCAKSAWYAHRQHSYNICKDFLSHEKSKFHQKYTDHKTIGSC